MKTPTDVNKKESSKNPGTIKKPKYKGLQEVKDRDKNIIDAYFVHYNKSRAVQEQGISKGNQSNAVHIFNSIYKDPKNQAYIDFQRSEVNYKSTISAARVVADVVNIHDADYTEILKCQTHDDVAKLPHSLKKLIKNYNIRERTEKDRQGNEVTTKEIKFSLVDKDLAISNLLKVTGAFEIDNRQKNNNGIASIIKNSTPEDAAMLLKLLTKKPVNNIKTIDISKK